MENILKKVNLKHIVQIITTISIIIFFVPTFLVSCQGKNISISTSNMTFGKSAAIYGTKQQIVTAHPVLLIFFLLPLVVLAIWTMDKIKKEKLKYIISGGVGLGDIIFWIALKNVVKEEAEKNLFTFSTTFWYRFAIFLMLILIAISVLLYLNILDEKSPVYTKIHMKDSTGWICSKCGNKLPLSADFCTKCGMQKEQSNSNSLENSGNGVCITCGAVISENSSFCTKCGRSIK